MIISASRRTDLPAYFMDWFLNRLEEGFVLVRNPMNPRQVSRIDLSNGKTDAIVFWSKNPSPLLMRIDELSQIPFEVQYTLNPYGTSLEPNLGADEEGRIRTFLELSRRTSPQRMLWRYDPILLNPRFPIEFHVREFERLAARLSGAVSICVISFVDSYRTTRRNRAELELAPLGTEEMRRIGQAFGELGRRYGIIVQTCAEKVDLTEFGIGHGSCIDGNRLERLTGKGLSGLKKDAGQRKDCGCVESADIGAYNTCGHGCVYCYANYNPAMIRRNAELHDPKSPLLFGVLGPEDRVTERRERALEAVQLNMF